MLKDLARIDDATRRAALDTRGDTIRTLIAERGIGALAAARARHGLKGVIRELAASGTAGQGAEIKGSTDICSHECPDITGRAMMAAAEAHAKQLRKEGGVPYVAHPLAVALHLARSGYDRDCIAAALVHDIIEDTEWDETMLAEALGEGADHCLALVRFATEPPKDTPWRARKAAVVTKLAGAARDSRALVIADKGHNLRSLLQALRTRGEAAWATLNRGREEQSWFAHALAGAVRDEPGEPFASFRATVDAAVGEGWLGVPPESEAIE